MTIRRLSLVGILVLLSTTWLPTIPANAAEEECDGFACLYDDTIDLRLENVEFVRIPARPSPKEYLYTYSCYIDDEVRTADDCVDGVVPTPDERCPSGSWALPRWARLRDAGGGVPGPWVLEVGYTCPGDREFPFQIEDFRQLLVNAPDLRIQPETGWVYAGLETIAYTDAAPRGWEVELLGMAFFIGAFPEEFRWDFGDGSPALTTTDPGSPWPDQTVSHTYTSAGKARPRMTTEWRGVYRNSDAVEWVAIPGSGQTTSVGAELTIYTARTRLVEDDLT